MKKKYNSHTCTPKHRICRIAPHCASICPTEMGKYICTRRKGHRGPHVACGNIFHTLLVWDEKSGSHKNYWTQK